MKEFAFADPSTICVLIGTFNTHLFSPPANTNLSSWLTHPSCTPDIVAVGLQELPWTVPLLKKKSEDQWQRLIEQTLPSHRLISSIGMFRMILFIYVHSNYLSYCSSISTGKVATGWMNLVGNKGAVGVRFNYANQSLCFLNAHLSAGESDTSYQRRNEEYVRIHQKMSFQPKDGRTWYKIHDHHEIFLFGDLNYRVRSSGEDELKVQSPLLETYSEAPIRFPPTYKYHPNTDQFNPTRRSSWTDRILYRSNTNSFESIDYWSPSIIRFSDHRPVASLLRFTRRLPR